MNPTPLQRRKRASARFFIRVEQRGVEAARDERTLPLFPLWLILDADDTLALDARRVLGEHTVRQVTA